MQFYIDENQIDADVFFQQLKIDMSAHKSVLQYPDIKLFWSNKRVFFQFLERQKIEINIPSILSYHERFFYKNSPYNQPLFKAIGLKKGKAKPKVFDCTAGMLGDSLLLYSILGSIQCCERNPLVSLLIKLTLKNSDLEQFEFFHGNCLDQSFDEIETIYFDPMYEEKNTKSAPKKEMQFFREVIGIDQDRTDIIQKLLELNKRLVVKRSSKAVSNFKPDISFGKKSTIYDVYLPKSI